MWLDGLELESLESVPTKRVESDTSKVDETSVGVSDPKPGVNRAFTVGG